MVFLVLNSAGLPVDSRSRDRNALLVVEDGRRALYNSAAIGMATAMLASIFIGLAGFYVISNAIGRDISSRCGFVIASTTVRGGEYLFAKLLGNLVFLGTFTAGFMLSSMGMLIVRNEAALEPWLFVRQYLLLVPPGDRARRRARDCVRVGAVSRGPDRRRAVLLSLDGLSELHDVAGRDRQSTRVSRATSTSRGSASSRPR